MEPSRPQSERDGRRRRGRLGLGAHIGGWMLAVGLIPLVALFLYGYLAAREALVEASDDHLVSVVGARRAQIEAWIRERNTDLEVIGGSQDCISMVQQAVGHLQHADVCRYLDSFQTGARDYRVLALFDLDWNWVASHSGGAEDAGTLVDPGLRRELEEPRLPVMSQARRDSILAPSIRFANVLRTPGLGPVGYVVADLDLTRTFAPILEDRAGLGRTGGVALADPAGVVFLTAGGADPVGSRLAPELREAVDRDTTGVVHYRKPSGQAVFAGFTRLSEPDWLLVAEMDQGEALGLLHSLRRGFLIAGLVTLGAVVLLSARSSRRLSAPLAELAGAARRIARGQHHERLPALEGREVAEVGDAFNEMLDALEEVQRQRLQAGTLAAVGELSSSMVHEIRNRLSSVKMNVQALERRVRGDEAYDELARIALEQVLRTEETLTDLLNYARPVQPEFESLDPGKILQGLADRFGAEAAAAEVTLEAAPADAPPFPADGRLLDQALSNLVRNAVEASPPGGAVRMRAGRVDGPVPGIFLEIEDEGPGFEGIPPEDLFKPFFTTKERGAGLGLATARKIAELHGGRIRAMRAKEGGTIFRIELPGERRQA